MSIAGRDIAYTSIVNGSGLLLSLVKFRTIAKILFLSLISVSRIYTSCSVLRLGLMIVEVARHSLVSPTELGAESCGNLGCVVTSKP